MTLTAANCPDVARAHFTIDDAAEKIAALKDVGAARFDALAFHHVEQLANRVRAQSPMVRHLLGARLDRAIESLTQRFGVARAAAAELAARATERFPAAADDLQQQLAGGEFAQLRRTVALLEAGGRVSDLAELTRLLSANEAVSPDPATVGRELREFPELKAIRYFRHTWSELSVQQQVKRAMAQAPDNAGPLNSHRLVLDALEQMGTISPEYLYRFVSYVDSLLSIDLADLKAKEKVRTPVKKSPGVRRTKA